MFAVAKTFTVSFFGFLISRLPLRLLPFDALLLLISDVKRRLVGGVLRKVGFNSRSTKAAQKIAQHKGLLIKLNWD
ncbi:hypothetical protein N9L23_06605 [Alphaproteobacteria bacterium]|nr:hypothetical protein [Alphaproteobacteria bacterium]